jgi:hypothetical protein
VQTIHVQETKILEGRESAPGPFAFVPMERMSDNPTF